MFELRQPGGPIRIANGPVLFAGRCDLPGELILRCGRRKVRCHRDPDDHRFWASLESGRGVKWVEVIRKNGAGEECVAARLVLNLRGRRRAGDYDEWVRRYDTLDEKQLDAIRLWQRGFAVRPVFSVLLPVYNPPLRYLQAAVESVRKQTWTEWELCIADDASPSQEVRDYLSRLPNLDARIKVVLREKNGHISAASNSALDLATGAWCALLDHDDTLAPHALTLFASEIGAHPEAAFLFSDEDKIDEEDRRFAPYFKPDWNPGLITSHNMVTHFAAYRTRLLRDLGGFRAGFEGSQDYDLVLRAADQAGSAAIRHVPHILYHWRTLPESTAAGAGAKPYAIDAARRAIGDHLQRNEESAEIGDGPWAGSFHVVPKVLRWPSVRILIPTRDRLDLLQRCIATLRAVTDYPKYVITLIDNQSYEADTLAYFAECGINSVAEIFAFDAPFNYAAMNNAAALSAEEEVLLFLNNDMEFFEAGWLKEIIAQLHRRDAGGVGARLLYPDRTIQHAGVVLGPGYGASHPFRGSAADAPGHNGRAQLLQDYSAVTAACLAVWRRVFEEVGGFDESAFPVAYNDVDLCLKIGAAGYRIIYTPRAVVLHHESASRGLDKDGEKRARFEGEKSVLRERWPEVLAHDPAYNPNLTIDTEHMDCAFPPRVGRPWMELL